jgi:hypothetical protein
VSVKQIISKVPPRYLLLVNILLWGGTFYRWIFVEQKSSLGMYPFAVAVPGIAALCYLAYYISERPGSTGDKIVGYLLSYSFLIAGVMGILGF